MPMVLWAVIIALSIALCFATAYLLMAVLIPMLGYATWHGYKQTIDASMWPENKKLNIHYPVDTKMEQGAG